MLRFVRIALLISISFVAGASISGCDDDTTTTVNDMAVSASADLRAPADLSHNHD